MSFCQYSNLLGVPGQGIHQWRLCNIAIVDTLSALLLAYLLQQLISPDTCYLFFALLVFLIGIIAHRMFCVRTTVDRALFN